jgi:peptidyl-prolyl cis-trans isomerase C
MAQEAISTGLDKRADVVEELERQRNNTLSVVWIREFTKSATVSEAELRKEYDAMVTAMPKEEYQVRNILTLSEKDAKAVIAELKLNRKFEELATIRSIRLCCSDWQ